MVRRLEEIEARVAEVDKLCATAQATERRVLENVAKFYAAQEKSEVAGLGALLEKLGAKPADLAAFYAAQEAEAARRIEAVTPMLQLTRAEIEGIERWRRGIVFLDPCSLVPPHSPGWLCQWTAASCGHDTLTLGSGTASAACAPAYAQNRADLRAQGVGSGTSGLAYGQATAWFDFDIPARPAPATVFVDVLLAVQGFYIVRQGPSGSAAVRLTATAEGYQYGYTWGSDSDVVFDQWADGMGRHDVTCHLQFYMATGADPLVVRVSLKLEARGKGGGALGVGDFATGSGNFIDVIYCNTYSS